MKVESDVALLLKISEAWVSKSQGSVQGIRVGLACCRYVVYRLYISIYLTCAKHAALTSLEAFLIQFWVVCQARGIPAVSGIQPPADHPFNTFETSPPVTFGDSITSNPDHRTAVIRRVKVAQPPPQFFCNHCPVVSTFKSLPGYWAHIRDSHSLTPQDVRLRDIIHAAKCWQVYKENCHTQGDAINLSDVTWKQAEQTKGVDFDWSVVMAWKLAYTRKRKFGKDGGIEEEGQESTEKC